MKKTLIIITALIIATAATAQMRLGLSLHASNPVGPLAGTDFNADDNGYAEPGAAVDINALYPINDVIYLSAVLGASVYDTDKSAMAEDVGSSDFSTGSWATTYWMVGASVGQHKKNIELRGVLMVGLMQVTSPDITAGSFYQPSEDGSSEFAWTVGGDLAYYPGGGNIGLVVDLKLVSGSSYMDDLDYTQPADMVNFGIGGRYRWPVKE